TPSYSCSMHPRPPKPPLFPYTTLFRSHPSAEAELRRVAESIGAKYPDVVAIAAVHRVSDLTVGDLAVVVGVSCPHRAEAFHACQDRKSTRLNSSHVAISYAVFCLKKKK